MIRLREWRFWTSLLVLGLGVYPIVNAGPLLRLGIGEVFATPRSAVETLAPLMKPSLVEAMARRDMLRLVEPGDPEQQANDLASYLNLQPLVGGAWLDLAAARLGQDAPPEKLASALALASLTSPNEIDQMAGRARFALPLWRELPPDLRRTVIGDLVNGWSVISDAQRGQLKDAMSEGPSETREQVRSALLLNGKAGAAIAAVLAPGDAAVAKP